ncbi:uncharacterized protein [Nicotiana sylvestris]|uniref:uncharacterized protein n=1 Tax=Nicotiana sylvestris TaxID=4096 RepID=UPI00388C835D
MSNLSKLEFVALDISGKNYLSWVLDAVIHLAAKGLGDTITQGNEASSQDKAKAMIFLRHHLDEGLKVEYLTAKDPFELWTGLKERYDHLKATILLRARYEWMHLQLQDFKTSKPAQKGVKHAQVPRTSPSTVQQIHRNRIPFSAVRGEEIQRGLAPIRDVMNDEDLLEKTLTTFHASNMVLQQQYRERGFKKYYELISCLLVVEQHNTLLLKNHEDRPTGSAPLPEVSTAARRDMSRKRQNNNHGYMNVRGHANGKRRYNSRHRDELGKGVAAECEHLQEKLRSMQSEMD